MQHLAPFAPFIGKTGRTALAYLAFCALALVVSNRNLLAWCGEWRHAALREVVTTVPDADVVFLGSSRTSRGIIPKIFDEKHAEFTGRPATSVNLGIMGQSRQVAYEVLRAWLERHAPPRVVFLETGDTDLVQWPHPLLDDMVRPFEALRLIAAQPYAYRDPQDFGQQDYGLGREGTFDPGGVFRAFDVGLLNIDLGLRALGRGPEDLARYVSNRFWNGLDGRGWDNPYRRSEERPGVPEILPAVTEQQVREAGWYLISSDARDFVEGKQALRAMLDAKPERAEAWREQRGEGEDDPRKEDHWDDSDWYRGARLYLDKIVRLCEAHGIRLIVHELPGFGVPRVTELQMDFHRERAEVFRPDMEILHRIDFFQDPGHLSTNGARWYSAQLAKYLAEHPAR